MTIKTKYEQKVKEYFAEYPTASLGQVARALGCSKGTVSRFKPAELKTPPLTEEELEAFAAQYELQKRMYEKLDWDAVKQVRDFNRYRLYPIEWGRVRANYTKREKEMPFDCKSAAEFEQLLKEVCDTLYDWHLYEKCPKCGKGIIIPVWHGGQWHPHCGCSEYPACKFSMDLDGKPVTYRTEWQEYHPPFINRGRLLRTVQNPANIICLDAETTGLEPFDGDEILQLSIIDGTGKVLFDEYIKPREKTSWEGAQAVNGISPEMVQDKATIDEHIPRLNEIMEGARLIVGYNIDFDLNFIGEAGIDIPETAEIFDVMKEFAPIFGEWDGRHRDFKYQKLAVCASFYGYESKGSFHDSLEDVRATLHSFFAMTEEGEDLEEVEEPKVNT